LQLDLEDGEGGSADFGLHRDAYWDSGLFAAWSFDGVMVSVNPVPIRGAGGRNDTVGSRYRR
jgi:hypothetical protein